jgi:hypothetical protein
MKKVVSMVTTRGQVPVRADYKAQQLYAAASSVFALPDYRQVLDYLDGGPEPELPDAVPGPNGYYSIGLMRSVYGGLSVRIVTDGGREVIVGHDRVAVNFRTGLRDASSEAAREVLEYLHQHTGDEICILELADGRRVSDADIAPDELWE